MPMLNHPFRRLLEARLRAGLTQEDLAARSGLSVRAVADIERGRTARPRASSLRLLATALGFAPADIEDLLLSSAAGRAREPSRAG